jgi:hypothetical protein
MQMDVRLNRAGGQISSAAYKTLLVLVDDTN